MARKSLGENEGELPVVNRLDHLILEKAAENLGPLLLARWTDPATLAAQRYEHLSVAVVTPGACDARPQATAPQVGLDRVPGGCRHQWGHTSRRFRRM